MVSITSATNDLKQEAAQKTLQASLDLVLTYIKCSP